MKCFKTLEIPIVEGRGFSLAYNDSASFVVNKAALKALNITNAIGTRITNQTRNLTGQSLALSTITILRRYITLSSHWCSNTKPGSNNNMLLKVNTTT